MKIATQNLLKLLLLLKLMMRNMPTTVWCKFGRLTLVIKLSFYSDFDIRFQGLFKILSLMCRQDFEVVSQMWSRSRLENNDRMPHESQMRLHVCWIVKRMYMQSEKVVLTTMT